MENDPIASQNAIRSRSTEANSDVVRGCGEHRRVPGRCCTGVGDVWAGCDGSQVDTVVQGLEKLENLEPDGHGGFYLAGIESTL